MAKNPGMEPTKAGPPAPFSVLQQRIGRKNLTKKILADAPFTT
jgi:DNA ligase-1